MSEPPTTAEHSARDTDAVSGSMAAAPRRFGLPTLTFLVIANMIGAGVFTTSGFTLASLGAPHRVVAAWIVAGGIALAGAVSYGRLARRMPESGGEYLFLSRAAHPLLGFIAGWVSLIAGFTGAIAFAAAAFESYLLPDAARPAWLPPNAVAIAVIVVAGVAHAARARAGAGLQNLAVLVKLAFLTVFIILIAARLPHDVWQGAPLPSAPTTPRAVAAAFATALVWISLSYSGFNAAVYIAGEAKTPQRNVPRALLLGTLVVTALYVLLNAAFVYGPSPDAIAGQEDVAAIAAHALGGPRIATLVRAIICLALFTSVLSMLMAAPRVYAKMAHDGFFPRWMRFHGDAPRWAIAAQVALAALFVLVSTLQGLLSYLGLTLSLCAAASAACLLLPACRTNAPSTADTTGTTDATNTTRATDTTDTTGTTGTTDTTGTTGTTGIGTATRPLWHPAHLPVYFYVVCTVGAGVIMAAMRPLDLLAAVATFAVGVCAYFLIPPSRRGPSCHVRQRGHRSTGRARPMDNTIHRRAGRARR